MQPGFHDHDQNDHDDHDEYDHMMTMMIMMIMMSLWRVSLELPLLNFSQKNVWQDWF